ncbi:hypothetical protein PFISCL1PPCAC_9644, partial [Pristionchus fissidentatus]
CGGERSAMSNEKFDPPKLSAEKVEIIEEKKKPSVNVEDSTWKMSSRDRATRLAVMQRTTFPDKLSVEPVSGQKVIQFILILGIIMSLAFFVMSYKYNKFSRS